LDDANGRQVLETGRKPRLVKALKKNVLGVM